MTINDAKIILMTTYCFGCDVCYEDEKGCNECEIKEATKMAIQALEEQDKHRWIPVSEKLPEEHDSIFAKLKGTDKWNNAMFEKISDNINITVEFDDGTRKTMTSHTTDGKWKSNFLLTKNKVIAWMPLPEPYKKEVEE